MRLRRSGLRRALAGAGRQIGQPGVDDLLAAGHRPHRANECFRRAVVSRTPHTPACSAAPRLPGASRPVRISTGHVWLQAQQRGQPLAHPCDILGDQ
jgi:hypothetical protein